LRTLLLLISRRKPAFEKLFFVALRRHPEVIFGLITLSATARLRYVYMAGTVI
jgi:hypothetical protein